MVEYGKITGNVCNVFHLRHWRLRKPVSSSLSFDFIGLWIKPTLVKQFQLGPNILELELSFFLFTKSIISQDLS